MFCGAAGAGFSTGLGFADFGTLTGFAAVLDAFLLFTADFAVNVFFVLETFLADADFAAVFAVVFFTAGFEAFLTVTVLVFFTGFADFTEGLLFFTVVVFLDGLTVLFVVFFFVVSFFTIDTSSEN
jgi:hypothetical protein